jgi:hypothetical protein
LAGHLADRIRGSLPEHEKSVPLEIFERFVSVFPIDVTSVKMADPFRSL